LHAKEVPALGFKTAAELLSILWKENPQLKALLDRPVDPEEIRSELQTYYFRMEMQQREAPLESLDPIDLSVAFQAIARVRTMLSTRAEEIADTSILSTLLALARQGAQAASAAFIHDMLHLLRATRSESDFGEGWLADVLSGSGTIETRGRAGAIRRSRQLDRISCEVDKWITRYPTSLEPQLARKRESNIGKILDHFKGRPEDWNDWSWHLKHVIAGRAGVDHLNQLVPLTDQDLEACRLAAEKGVPYGVTPYYLSLFDFDRDDRRDDYAVRAQVIPPLDYVKAMAECGEDRSETFDYMGEHDTSPVDLVTRRYPMVCILKPYNTCPQICVYCQRNWEISGPLQDDAEPEASVLENAIRWVEDHPGHQGDSPHRRRSSHPRRRQAGWAPGAAGPYRAPGSHPPRHQDPGDHAHAIHPGGGRRRQQIHRAR